MSTGIELSKPVIDIGAEMVAASAARDVRGRAALKRQIDKFALEANTSGEPDMIAQMKLGVKAYELTEYTYPELFNSIFLPPNSESDYPTFTEFARAISTIYTLGELQTWKEQGSDTYVTADALDLRAAQIEDAAKALYLFPPSQDFLKDHGLRTQSRPTPPKDEYPHDDNAELVADFLMEADELDRKLAKIHQKYNEAMKHYSTLDSETNPVSGVEMARVLVGMIDDVAHHMPDDKSRDEFESRLAGVNTERTGLNRLRLLYMEGMELAGRLTKAAAAQKRAMYDAVISGEATTYVSPRPELVESVAP